MSVASFIGMAGALYIERELPGCDSTGTPAVMEVRCRACGHGWTIAW